MGTDSEDSRTFCKDAQTEIVIKFPHNMNDFSPDLVEGIKPKEPQVPEKVYINLQPRFASLVFTVPNLEVDLPENVSLQRQGELSVALRNNGRFQLDRGGYQGISGKDWSVRTTIDDVQWYGESISGDDLLERRTELLNRYFVETLGSEEAVQQMRAQNEAGGLRRDSYLYRAISEDEARKIKRDGNVYYSHLDPSANFENEEMYNGAHSQVKHYAARKEEGYSRSIVRWRIEDPLLYRPAGMAVRRITPMFSHYLRQDLEVSDDGGQTFKPFFPPQK